MKKTIFYLLAIFIIATACEKNEQAKKTDNTNKKSTEAVIDTTGTTTDETHIKFKFRLLDTLGNEKTVFNQGENIIFSFQVINKSSEDLCLENFLPNDDFFKVYQSNTNEGLLNYGKTYDGICYIGCFSVPANQTLEIKCPWVNSEKSAHYFDCLHCEKELHERLLPFGKYYTEFSQSFKFGEIQTEEKHFKINFTIK